MASNMQIGKENMGESLNELWSTWEIRVLVMSSLFLQIFLFTFAGHRKRLVPIRMSKSTSFSLRAPLSMVLHWLLWLSYLLADIVATSALGYLSQYEDSNTSSSHQKNQTKHLIMFWTPFLLLHLGSQDTITALSIEDNELWMRHLLTLISQVGFAIYVYCKSNPGEGGLWPAAIPMFIAGTVKYAERTWSLQRASMSGLWSSVVNVPEPIPNHAKLMEEYVSNMAAGLPSHIIVVGPQHEFMADREGQTIADNGRDDEPYDIVLCKAYGFFQMFKGLLVDLILSLENWEESRNYFRKLASKDAFKIIEIEHFLMYEMLHSKSALLHNWYGCASRSVTLVCSLAAFSIFLIHGKSGFGRIELCVTYVLLGGAVGLEIVSVFFMVVSIWTFAAMMKSVSGRKLGRGLFYAVKLIWPAKKSLWSNRMAQYNLITFAILDKPCLWGKIIKFIRLKEKWDNYRYTTYVPIESKTKDLNTESKIKDLVFEELKSKMDIGVDDHKGQWALRGYYDDFGWSVDNEFEKSILIWHVATDLLFHTKYEIKPNSKSQNDAPNPEIGQHISNYMLFLLIMRPFMLPAGIGKIRFEGTGAEARNFFKTRRYFGDAGADPRKMILKINTDYDPSATRNSGSMSVLFDGCKLAHQLEARFNADDAAMWELINAVWVEMLCFAANKCSGQSHAKQMSKGGEFLTMVWMLMAHLGLGEQCKVEVNPIVKLVVGK